eukprot:Gb_20711 [translate_table: standard]
MSTCKPGKSFDEVLGGQSERLRAFKKEEAVIEEVSSMDLDDEGFCGTIKLGVGTFLLGIACSTFQFPSTSIPLAGSSEVLEESEVVNHQRALDTEDVLHLGHRIDTCPYYGLQALIPSTNLGALPYQSLLIKSARESLGVNLKDSIVIIGEAHNLVDSLTNMHDSKITILELQHVHSHLKKLDLDDVAHQTH